MSSAITRLYCSCEISRFKKFRNKNKASSENCWPIIQTHFFILVAEYALKTISVKEKRVIAELTLTLVYIA
jgi:hypothetical protein